MSPGSHAAGDGSFGRSTGVQAGRAALLIGLAVLIGFIFLHNTGSAPPVSAGTTGTSTFTTTPITFGSGGGTASTTPTTARSGTTTPATTGQPQDIKVLVANGTSTPGVAARVSNTLHTKGYNTLASTNSTQRPTSTVIYFQPTHSGDALAMAAKLNLPATAVLAIPQPPPVANLNGANILVVVGPDLATAASTTPTT